MQSEARGRPSLGESWERDKRLSAQGKGGGSFPGAVHRGGKVWMTVLKKGGVKSDQLLAGKISNHIDSRRP